jgi:SAM-dependent methyltransferase
MTRSRDLTNDAIWDAKWKAQARRRTNTLIAREWTRTIERVLSRLGPGARVLELGIAPGTMALAYAEARSDLSIDGVDISDVGLKATRRVFDARGIDGRLFLGDVRDHPDLPGDYDLVCSHGLVEHFEDVASMIRLHLDHARPGGWIFVTVPNYACFPVLGLLRRFSREAMRTHNMSCMSLAFLGEAVATSGTAAVETGAFGGSYLPHSSVNPGVGGRAYKLGCRAWNLAVSCLANLTFHRVVPRFWDANLYVLARKATLPPDSESFLATVALGGMTRSGTTIFEKAFCTHRDVGFVHRLHGRFPRALPVAALARLFDHPAVGAPWFTFDG